MSKVCPFFSVTIVILIQYNKLLAQCLISSRESICKDSELFMHITLCINMTSLMDS